MLMRDICAMPLLDSAGCSHILSSLASCCVALFGHYMYSQADSAPAMSIRQTHRRHERVSERVCYTGVQLNNCTPRRLRWDKTR
jgi:hypothetical protein